MADPRISKLGEDDIITDLSIPTNTVLDKLILEEPPFDEEDTARSLPLSVIPLKPTPEKSPAHDAETTPSHSKKRGKSKRQNLKNE